MPPQATGITTIELDVVQGTPLLQLGPDRIGR
jgi:hypothetical protein